MKRLAWLFESYALAKVPKPSPSLPSAPNFHAFEIMLPPDMSIHDVSDQHHNPTSSDKMSRR